MRTFIEHSDARTSPENLAERVERTLEIIHRWGYAPTLDALSRNLLGGPVARDRLAGSLSGSSTVVVADNFAYLHGNEDLLVPSAERVAANRASGPEAEAVATRFASDLVATCPFVRCVALSGSLASGGYAPGDDIDFDLFVDAGSKYLSYLVANLLGLRYAWRARHARRTETLGIRWLPKVVCINVVWALDDARPFVRQDASMAFEILRCRPLYGTRTFEELLRANDWIWHYFPQAYDRVWADSVEKRPNALHRMLTRLAQGPAALRVAEFLSKRLAWVLYCFVQGRRGRDPRARARMAFLRRVKYPYEIFEQAP